MSARPADQKGHHTMERPFRGATLFITAGVALTLAISLVTTGVAANAAGPTTVILGSASTFAILAGTPAVTNTGASIIAGDLGIHPAAAVTGFPPGIVAGAVHTADAQALLAKNDLAAAYTDAAGRPVTSTIAALSGTLVGGVYNSGPSVLSIAGTVTLDGQNDPSSVWIFQAQSGLTTASTSTVTLINGANPCNVFWQVTSSATLGSGSNFVGTILALSSITMDDGVTVNGRALARNGDVTLINDRITRPNCASATAATPAPTATPTASPTASATPSAAPTVVATATPGPTVAAAATPSAAPSVRSLPSTATADDDYAFVILALAVSMFVILYMVARARRRAHQPAV